MKHARSYFWAVVVAGTLLTAPSAQGEAEHEKPYAGQQSREVKSLSADDVSSLRRGGGWGLAKAAELNGLPGPAHLLEMQLKLNLTREQVEKIDEIHRSMKTSAIRLGKRLIASERALDHAFQSPKISKKELGELLAEIADVRRQLRYVHLAAHLYAKPVLSAHQIELYNRARGYTSDPCAKVLEGHDRALRKKHNGCQ